MRRNRETGTAAAARLPSCAPTHGVFGKLVLIALMWGATLTPSSVAAQDADPEGRAPQFLALSSIPTDPPRRIDVSEVPALRRRVSVTVQRMPVVSVLRLIREQSGLDFAYSTTAAPRLERLVSLDARRITVAAALTEILIGTGLDVLLTSHGKRAMLIRRGEHMGIDTVGTLTGSVAAEESGAPIAGASVVVGGTERSAITDEAGRFVLVDVPVGHRAITVRYIGYQAATKRVRVGADTVVVNFTLKAQAVALEELVTTATGKQRRRDIGNSITTIRADSVVQNVPIRNMTDLLESRVPGLSVQHTSGAPGDPARLRLRGLSSLRASNDPVVVVDGVRLYAAQAETRSGNLADPTSPAPSPLDQIDPNIIETVDVLKGPSAATLYGADAANGVIVITTKRGRPGPTQWSMSADYGRTHLPGRYPEGYYRWGHSFGDNEPRFCALADVGCEVDSLVRFQALNDPRFTVLGSGRSWNASITASGGSQNLNYSVTGTYGDETGYLHLPSFEVEQFRQRFSREAPDWMRSPLSYSKWSVTSSVTARLGATANVSLTTMLSKSEQQRSTLERQVSTLAGTYIDPVNRFYYQPHGNGGYVDVRTPHATLFTEYYRRTTASYLNFTTSLGADWNPAPWFNANGTAGINVSPRDDQDLLPAGLASLTDSGAFSRGTGRSLVSTLNIAGRIIKPLGWGFTFRTSVGADLTTTNTDDLYARGTGLIPGTSTITGARQISATDSRNRSSVFGWHVEPSIMGERISLGLGLRLDGGSNYGVRATRGLGLALPRLNGAWVISEEPFFPFTSLFTYLQLRGAYGQAQVQPPTGDRLRLYRYTSVLDPNVVLESIGNTQLLPERSREFEGGFAASMVDGRVTVDFTLYRQTRVDALYPVPLPMSVNGGGSVYMNIGEIQNTGMDIELQLTPLAWATGRWSTALVYNQRKNKIVDLGPSVEPNYQMGLVQGYPISGRWSRPIVGYSDVNGDGVLWPSEVVLGDSLVYMGGIDPVHEMGLSTDLQLFQGAVGISANFAYESGATQIDHTARQNWVLSPGIADPASPLGQQAAMLMSTLANKTIAGVTSPRGTDYGVTQDIAMLRFSTLSIRYQAPASLTQLFRAQRMSIALQGRNLGLHTKYSGRDPDVNAWGRGEGVIDTGQLPQPRLWRLAIQLQY